ncbi:hypothetical protein ACP70R_008657 [Stipagrostis hirtigluma subsp. patula]
MAIRSEQTFFQWLENKGGGPTVRKGEKKGFSISNLIPNPVPFDRKMAELVVGGVERVVKLGLEIQTAVETARQNEEDCREIDAVVGILVDILSPPQNMGERIDPSMRGALRALEMKLNQALELVKYCQKGGFLRRFLKSGTMSKKLQRMLDQIDRYMIIGNFAASNTICYHFTLTDLNLPTQGKITIVIKVQQVRRLEALDVVCTTPGAIAGHLVGDDSDRLAILGEGIDSINLGLALRKKVGHAELLQVGPVTPCSDHWLGRLGLPACLGWLGLAGCEMGRHRRFHVGAGMDGGIGPGNDGQGPSVRYKSCRNRAGSKVKVAHSDVESESDGDGKHISHRFSASRIVKIVHGLQPAQKDFIIKYGFGFVFNIVKFRVPVQFLEWIMEHTFATSNEFIFKQKRIQFTRDMVVKVLGIPSGQKEVEVSSPDFQIDALVDGLKAQYKVGLTYPINKCIELMKAELDEEKFMRHFMLYLISTILIPGKANTTCVEYLYSLLDIKKLTEYDWAERVLYVLMCEVHRFHSLRDFLGRAVARSHFWMEGCLPLLAIVYADFLDLPKGSRHVHSLNYSIPRICHVSTTDFLFVMEIDRDNNGPRHHFYGVRPFRHISDTPYHTIEPAVVRNPALKPDHFLHRDVLKVVNKHRLLWKEDLGFVVKTFNDVHERRVISFASDMNSLYMMKISELSGAGTSGEPHCANVAATEKIFPSPGPATGLCSDVPSAVTNICGQVGNDLVGDIAKDFSSFTTDSFVDGKAAGESTILPVGVGQIPAHCVEDIVHHVSSHDDQVDIGHVHDKIELTEIKVVHEVGSLDKHDSDCKTHQTEAAIETHAPFDDTGFEGTKFDLSQEKQVSDEAFDGLDTTVDVNSIFGTSHIDVGAGLEIAMNLDEQSPLKEVDTPDGLSPSLGNSTIDLKNRKKRHASDLADPVPYVVEVSSAVETFYNNYVRKQGVRTGRAKNVPPFVDVGGIDLTYQMFRESFKPRSDLRDLVFAAYCHCFNSLTDKSLFNKSDIKRIAFSPFFAKKLLVKPELFQTRCCIGEFRKLHQNLKIHHADLIFFPILLNNHWTLICINKLWGELHYFDSLNLTESDDRERMVRTLAANFSKLCAEANVCTEGFKHFKSNFLDDIPRQSNIHDCGFYSMLYMNLFNGKNLRKFGKDAAVQYRKVAAHLLVHSDLNKTFAHRFRDPDDKSKVEASETSKKHEKDVNVESTKCSPVNQQARITKDSPSAGLVQSANDSPVRASKRLKLVK